AETRGVYAYSFRPEVDSSENTFQMVGEPQGQGDEVQRWIGCAIGGEYGAARNEQICKTVHLQIGIDDALLRVLVHSRGAEMVIAPIEDTKPVLARLAVDAQHADFRRKQLPPQFHQGLAITREITVRTRHVQLEARHAKR